ncbi:MAG: hypothetical protein KAQ75_14895, partial [Bacteroidales bacterium]|nr:hypothetical protein [Bacteroidales bacterium]
PNYTHYFNHEYDKLYEQAMLQVNDSIRYTLYNKMNQIIIDDAVVVPLYYDEVIRFVNKDITGFESNPMNLLNLKYVKKQSNL